MKRAPIYWRALTADCRVIAAGTLTAFVSVQSALAWVERMYPTARECEASRQPFDAALV